MRFELQEFRLEPVMRVGDMISMLAKIGPIPPKLEAVLKRSLRGADKPLVLGRARFEDGREYWTLTGSGISRKKAEIQRTSVYDKAGTQVFSGRQSAVGSLHTMEGRHETKLVKSVMNS